MWLLRHELSFLDILIVMCFNTNESHLIRVQLQLDSLISYLTQPHTKSSLTPFRWRDVQILNIAAHDKNEEKDDHSPVRKHVKFGQSYARSTKTLQ